MKFIPRDADPNKVRIIERSIERNPATSVSESLAKGIASADLKGWKLLGSVMPPLPELPRKRNPAGKKLLKFVLSAVTPIEVVYSKTSNETLIFALKDDGGGGFGVVSLRIDNRNPHNGVDIRHLPFRISLHSIERVIYRLKVSTVKAALLVLSDAMIRLMVLDRPDSGRKEIVVPAIGGVAVIRSDGHFWAVVTFIHEEQIDERQVNKIISLLEADIRATSHTNNKLNDQTQKMG